MRTAPLTGPRGRVRAYGRRRPVPRRRETPRALETEELPGIVAQYGKAARNALRAGFDGVELHVANGYLIDEFLQDNANQRADRYGGSVPNRTRLLLEVIEELIRVVGADRVGVRISPSSTFQDMADSQPQELFVRPAVAAYRRSRQISGHRGPFE
ncbi:hypothetical protein [Streptomyces sp. NPDC056512]|uniref:oxidoreductase n=1 Tax=Streptomyces sp. NPDC056512 TaxID=3345846 RepID=UPI0036B1E9C0